MQAIIFWYSYVHCYVKSFNTKVYLGWTIIEGVNHECTATILCVALLVTLCFVASYLPFNCEHSVWLMHRIYWPYWFQLLYRWNQKMCRMTCSQFCQSRWHKMITAMKTKTKQWQTTYTVRTVIQKSQTDKLCQLEQPCLSLLTAMCNFLNKVERCPW